MRVDVYHHLVSDSARFDRIDALLAELLKGQKHLMSQVTDFAAQEEADLSAIETKIDTVITGIAALDKLITDLETAIPADTLSPEAQAALAAVSAHRTALVAKIAAIDTTAPAPTVDVDVPPPPPAGPPA